MAMFSRFASRASVDGLRRPNPETSFPVLRSWKVGFMRGFTLVEFIVVAALIALAATMGMRLYFTYVESYRFLNVLSDFKFSINMARARSLSGVVSTGGTVGDTPAALFVTSIEQRSATSVALTTKTNHKLSTADLPVYVTLRGFAPTNTDAFKTNLFPYVINGPQWKVTAILGDNSFVADSGLPVPSHITTALNPQAVAFMNYTVRIRPVESLEGQSYSRVEEKGPVMDFQYLSSILAFTFQSSESGSTPQPQGSIVFAQGLTSGERTYTVSFRLIKTRGEDAKATFTVLPAGVVR